MVERLAHARLAGLTINIMTKPIILVTTFLALVLAICLSGLGFGTNPIYRAVMALMIVLRFGWIVWDRRRRAA